MQVDNKDQSQQMINKKDSYIMKSNLKLLLLLDELNDYEKTADQIEVHRASIYYWVK